MSERIRSITAVLVIALSLGVSVAVLASDSTASSDRVHALADRLKCPVCTSESIADSPSQVSRDLYQLISEQVADGRTDREIEEFFIARYGNEVLLDPPAGGATSMLWIAPVIAIGVGGIVIARRLGHTTLPVTDVDRARVERAMQERE